MYSRFIKINVFCLVLGCVFCACGTREVKTIPPARNVIIVNDYNVVIVPDLSNRINPKIYPKAVHDTILINALMDHAVDFLNIKNRQLNQLDVYKFDFVNNGILNKNVVVSDALKIDLRQFKNKGADVVDYINNKMPVDVDTFKHNVAKVYEYALNHPSGSDLWNYFNETINNSVVKVPDDTSFIASSYTNVIKRNQNVLILFTDGYIESANKGKGYTLGGKAVDDVRNAFLKSGSKDLKTFIYSHPECQLNKTTNSLNGLNIMINELIDRSKDANGVALKQPTDFQIMKIIWEKWLKDSGAAHVEVYTAIESKKVFVDNVRAFLEEI